MSNVSNIKLLKVKTFPELLVKLNPLQTNNNSKWNKTKYIFDSLLQVFFKVLNLRSLLFNNLNLFIYVKLIN